MTKKLSNQNTSKLDVGNCVRCGRPKRLSKLVRSRIGWLCRRCAQHLEATDDH